jgi:catalase
MDTTNVEEILVKQGKNTVTSMENLKRRATNRDKERSDLYQKFRAGYIHIWQRT